MKTLLLHRVFTAAGLFGLLVRGVLAAPQAASNDKPAVQTTAAITPAAAVAPLQPVAPIGGAFPPAPIDPAQRLRYFAGPSPTVLGGWFGSTSVGGAFQAGPIGGTMFGQMPPGGRMTNIFGGAYSAGFNPGGIMTAGHPPGGQLGPGILGGTRNSASSFSSGSGGLILGGAQPVGASPGGLLVPGASPGGVIVPGTALGGVLVGGAPPIANAPGGRLTNAPGGQLH